MKNQQHPVAGRFLRKALSVTLATTLLLSMVTVGNVFGLTAFAEEIKSEGDYAYMVRGDGTARITKYNGTESQVTVPEKLGGVSVSAIGERAFESCGTLRSVNIPVGVTEIDYAAFKNCQMLTNVGLPSALTTIGMNAFDGCVALDNVDIPESVTEIHSNAFKGTASLKSFTLHEGIQTLNTAVFEESALTSIYIPKTLSETNDPFSGSNITEVRFGEGITTLTNTLFADAGKLTEITIPDTVSHIGSFCFKGTNIEAIVIPDSVKTIDRSAFEDCDNLYAVKFGAGVTKIPDFCFNDCAVLQNVMIPETVVAIGYNAFQHSGLGYQKLPQSVHVIPEAAFRDCADLTTVECSDQLEGIGDYAFEGCARFTTLRTAAASVDFNNTTFKDCPRFTDKRFYVFNAANTGIESTGNLGTDHTLVHFTVKYDIRDDWKDEAQMNRLYLHLPDPLEPITSSFAAEGFDLETAVGSDFTSFDLTGAETRGVLRFSAYLNSGGDVNNVSAEVEFYHKSFYFRKPLGEVQFSAEKLSILAPSRVTEPKINVSGYTASVDQNVTVSISRVKADGTREDAVTYTLSPNRFTGKYAGEELAILPADKSAVTGDVFEVSAACDGVTSDVVTFDYVPGALKVVKATETVNITKFVAPYETNLSHGGQTNTYDITGIFTQGTSPVVLINPAEMYQFKFDFENDEDIAQVVLMSHKGNEWKFMQLFYDAETDLWIGEGYFDIFDHELVPDQSYVPGALNLYTVRGEREDTYKSHYYGADGTKSAESVGASGGVPYYDHNGNLHGNPGNYQETALNTLISTISDLVSGGWLMAGNDFVSGGLQTLWEWGITDDNGFALLHGGNRIGSDGTLILKGDDLYNRDPRKDGKQRNAIDPSGVVYEAVKSNPIEGATATIYKLNEETNEWEVWNAADFEQQNPLMTNSEGAYAWMTDEGRFKVTVTKEGYEPQTSEEFNIPPEKLGLDFNLADKTTHPAATVTPNEEPGSFTVKFSKFMKPETVNTETVIIEGLDGVRLTPVYRSEGDAYADTFTVKGTLRQKNVRFTVTANAQSYSGVSAAAVNITAEGSLVLGDADGDGIVTITDATTVQKYIAEYELPNPDVIERCGDVDGDGVVTISDATNIQKYIAEHVLPYPIGKPIA